MRVVIYIILILLLCVGCGQRGSKPVSSKTDTTAIQRDTARALTFSEQIDITGTHYFDYRLIKEPTIKPILKGMWNRETDTTKLTFVVVGTDSAHHLEVSQSKHTILINRHPFKIIDLFPYDCRFTNNQEEINFHLDHFFIYKCYHFAFQRKNYLALYMMANYCSSMPIDYLAFFNLQENMPKFLFSRIVCCENLDCFNDYNNDGVLDFAEWCKDDTLKCISIYPDNTIRVDQDHYLLIQPDTTKPPMYYPYLIKSRERWFK